MAATLLDQPPVWNRRRQVFRTMITPAAWSNQASGASVRRLSGGFMLAGWAGLAARMPPEQANPVARKAVGGCDDREWFEWGCSWGNFGTSQLTPAMRFAQGSSRPPFWHEE